MTDPRTRTMNRAPLLATLPLVVLAGRPLGRAGVAAHRDDGLGGRQRGRAGRRERPRGGVDVLQPGAARRRRRRAAARFLAHRRAAGGDARRPPRGVRRPAGRWGRAAWWDRTASRSRPTSCPRSGSSRGAPRAPARGSARRRPGFAARPRQGQGSSGVARTYLTLGFVKSLVKDRLTLGLYAMLPISNFTTAQGFYPDQREALFTNSLHPELYGDRLTAVSIVFGGGVQGPAEPLAGRVALGRARRTRRRRRTTCSRPRTTARSCSTTRSHDHQRLAYGGRALTARRRGCAIGGAIHAPESFGVNTSIDATLPTGHGVGHDAEERLRLDALVGRVGRGGGGRAARGVHGVGRRLARLRLLVGLRGPAGPEPGHVRRRHGLPQHDERRHRRAAQVQDAPGLHRLSATSRPRCPRRWAAPATWTTIASGSASGPTSCSSC